jgi:hypothetical protein
MPRLENKERILKAAREKPHLIHKGKHVSHLRPLSTNIKDRKAWSNIFQSLKENNCQLSTLYPAVIPQF